MAIRMGSWGLPELGITEAIGRLRGVPTQPSGGSNLFGQYQMTPRQRGTYDYVKQMNVGGKSLLRKNVLGASTSGDGGGGNVQQPQGGDGGGGDGGGDGGGGNYDPYAQLRGDISSGWDQYLGSLDQQLYGLGEQRTGQEGIAQSQFNQGVNTLDLQRGQGMQQLGQQTTQVEQNQAKNLRDLGANLKNSFMAGNVYLGARGAGDSSAANQYAFALTKMGSQQRGDIMTNTANIKADIAGRETNLSNMYNTEKNNLSEGLNQQVQGIAQWFANAQQTIQMQKAQGQLSKGQDLASLTKDILNQAMTALQQVQTDARTRQSGLDSWAMSNSKNLAQLKQNMTAVSSPQYKLPQARSLTGTPQYQSSGSFYIPQGYGQYSDEKKTSLFG